MSSPGVDELSALLADGYRTLVSIRWCQAAGLTLLMYDYILTLDLEVRYFWQSMHGRWKHAGFLRLLFLSNRYLPILTQILNTTGAIYPRVSDKFCNVWFRQVVEITGTLEWFAIPAAIVCYRTCALYSHNIRAIVGLVATYLVALIAVIILIVICVQNDRITSQFVPNQDLGVKACHSLSPPGFLYAVFIPPLISDIIMCTAALYKLIVLHNRTRASSDSHVLQSMALHSVLYCCVIAVSATTNLIIYKAAPDSMRHIFDGIMFALISISCNRLLLHLRELGDIEKTDFFSSKSCSSTTDLYQSRRM